MDFFPEIHVSDMEAELIARGLMAVAKADGTVLERESAMIRMFATGDSASADRLETAAAIEPANLAAGLSRSDIRRLFLKSCFLVAYADGNCADSERKLISAYASSMTVPGDELARIEESVKDYLLGQLNHVRNSDAVVNVAKGMNR